MASGQPLKCRLNLITAAATSAVLITIARFLEWGQMVGLQGFPSYGDSILFGGWLDIRRPWIPLLPTFHLVQAAS